MVECRQFAKNRLLRKKREFGPKWSFAISSYCSDCVIILYINQLILEEDEMTTINYPTCINKCYIPENTTKDNRIETYEGKLLGKVRYYELNPCMLRFKFAQLAVTDWVVQPIMTIVMMVVEIYMSIRFMFNCLPREQQVDDLKVRAKIAGGMFLHALSLPFVIFIPALLAAYSVIDVKNGRHAYCAVEKYMYDAMGVSNQRFDDMDICTARKPFLSHVAKPFAPVEVVNAYEKHCKASQKPAEVPIKEIRKNYSSTTVDLEETATQYRIEASEADPKNERPPACTFHALVALHEISKHFGDWCAKLHNQNSAKLSDMQKAIIKEGLIRYSKAVQVDRSFKQGVDLAQIKDKLPNYLKELYLDLGDTDQSTQLVETRVEVMVDGLFADTNQKHVAWIKSGNDESFAVICHQNLAIVFDSHKNQLSLLSGKEETRKFLIEKLSEHATIFEGADMTAFLYATGSSLT
jgi:hypothetical protein